MDNNNYTSGSWLGIVRHGAVVVLEAGTDPAILDHLWHHLGQEPTIHGVLHEVTKQFGTGLVDLPSFAILLPGERLHAILRGDITLAAHTAEGTELVSGRDVTTWSERSLLLPDSLELTLADGPEPATVLPVGEAVVRLQSLRLSGFFPDVLDKEGRPGYGLIAGALPSEPPMDETPSAEMSDNALSASAPSVEMSDNALFDGNADEALDEDGLALDVDNQAFDENFARAADAEWNAQLAPVDVTGAPVDTDLGLTMYPDNSEDALVGSDEPGMLDEMEQPVEAGPAGGAGADGFASGSADDGEFGGDQVSSTAIDGEPSKAGTADGTDETSGGQHDGLAGGEPADAAQDLAEDGFTTNYDFLFGATVAQSVENAAVRLDDDGQPLEPVAPEAVVPPLPTQPPLVGSNPVDSGVETAAEPAAEPADVIGQGAGMLIDSVPWAHSAQQSDAGQHAFVKQAFIKDIAAQQPAAQAAADAAAAPYDPDHDGHTVLRGALNLEPESESPSNPETEAILESRPPTGPMVLARVCPNGHANPPSLPSCFSCGAAITAEPRTVGRPRLGTMHISNGEVVELDHSLIIGRQPSVSRVMGQAMPRLVQVKSGNDDISRSHVEVRLDGWDVLLVDLKATNGTVLVREGQTPRRLGQGEEAILLNGDIAELGDGVTLLFDGLL